jgi:hypothetical protein
MKTLRMAAAAALAFTLMACGGVPPPSEPAPEPSADSEVSAQGCTSYYICNGDFSRKYSSPSSCASSCPDGAAGCGEERLCCNAGVCEWL